MSASMAKITKGYHNTPKHLLLELEPCQLLNVSKNTVFLKWQFYKKNDGRPKSATISRNNMSAFPND